MLSITSPMANQVIQQNAQGAAMLSVKGFCETSTTTVLVRLSPMKGGSIVAQNIPAQNGRYEGLIRVTRGWYTMQVSQRVGDVSTTSTVERVGVGEVFVVAGHSVAQGDAQYTLDGSTDERVVTIPVPQNKTGIQYKDTGLPADMARQFSAYGANVYPGPFGSNTHFWAKFGQTVAELSDCPVAIFNAAFGGTSLVHWAKSATGQSFVHSFVDSSKGFPYVNLKNTLNEYVKLTGIRAVLMDQGQNDHEEMEASVIFGNYKTVVDKARIDSGIPRLAMVINRQTPYRVRTAVRQAQERMVAEVSDCFAGPDYDALLDTDRYDGVHLNVAGQEKAAREWALVVTNPQFRTATVPYQPNPASRLDSTALQATLAGMQPAMIEPTYTKSALRTMFVVGALVATVIGLSYTFWGLATSSLTSQKPAI